MTPAKMDALPAGRELDALVAEKVMGLCIERAWYDARGYRLPDPHDPEIPCHEIYYAPRGAANFGTLEIPHYSRDIEAAWEVVEKLTERFSVLVGQFHRGGTACKLTSWEIDGEMIHANMLAEAAPLAICRAALKAVGP